MADKPTDEALENLFVEETGFDPDDFPAAIFVFTRAALAKWGTPAPVGAVPLTPDQIAEIADAAHREYDRLVSSGQCAPRWSAVFAHLLEMHHGIKGDQHVE